MHTGDRDRGFSTLTIVNGHYAAALDPPLESGVVFVLQAVTQPLHSMQRLVSHKNFIVAIMAILLA